jgi:hypothetical protein
MNYFIKEIKKYSETENYLKVEGKNEQGKKVILTLTNSFEKGKEGLMVEIKEENK